MQFKQLKSLRTFIFLFLTVFLTDTVYANVMMVADQLHCNLQSNVNEHCIEPGHADIHSDHHKGGVQQKQSTSDHCSKCGHCMACLTVLPPSHLDGMQSQVQATTIILFEPTYHSHVSAQPQRPPIS